MIEIFRWEEYGPEPHWIEYIFFKDRVHFLSVTFGGEIVSDYWNYADTQINYWVKLTRKESQKIKARFL
jgi:hypothetical protein